MIARYARRAAALLCLVLASAACDNPFGSGGKKTEPAVLKATQIAAGEYHVCALDADSLAVCWGDARSASTGHAFEGLESCVDGLPVGSETACSQVPRTVAGGHRYRSLVAGGDATCGIRADGTALCWGPTGGVLGTSGAASCWPEGQPCNVTPVPVAGGHRWASLDIAVVPFATSMYACGVTEAGEGYCWGRNTQKRLGTGSHDEDASWSAPQPVAGGLRFRKIAAGWVHSCGLAVDGAAYCWGGNQGGQLGTAAAMSSCTGYNAQAEPVPVACSPVPVAVQGGHTFTDVRVSIGASCGLTTGGELYCWGYFAGTGRGTPQVRRVFPGLRLQSFAMGNPGLAGINADYLCGVAQDGAAYCWAGSFPAYGQNGDGIPGQPPRGSEPTPARVTGTARYTRLALTTESACGITTEGSVNCWGRSMYGSLGRPAGNGTGHPTPAPVDPVKE
ncbi:MAG TPA: hypothetical protein VGC13_10385 [Longimicrobium sp.]|jgi:hypothetical protein|uniref:RCC1 domain-containing protein n=1 Tax=Longimicrobium sp. TaxID=2029185 RepID=UPI002ED90550